MFKFISRSWQKRRERYYFKNRWHLVLEFSLGVIIVLLAAVVVGLHFYRPSFSWPLSPPTINKIEKPELDLNNPPLTINYSVASSSLHLVNGSVLKISLKNASDFLLQDVVTDLVMINKNFSISKIEKPSSAAGITITNNRINLGFLNPKEEREVELKVYFITKNEVERVIKWQAQSQYSVQGQVIKESSSLPDLKLASELSAQAAIYYNSPQGDQLGSGPLPPVVGLPTNYWVFFEVYSIGDFKNFVFSAKLPKGVELTDRRSLLAGDFQYNAAARQIIWKLSDLKNQNDNYRLGFEIQFIPDASLLAKTSSLITNLKYFATDALSGEEQYSDLPYLSSNLDFDRLNKGQGEIKLP